MNFFFYFSEESEVDESLAESFVKSSSEDYELQLASSSEGMSFVSLIYSILRFSYPHRVFEEIEIILKIIVLIYDLFTDCVLILIVFDLLVFIYFN